MTSFYCATRFIQNEEEFFCNWNLCYAAEGNPSVQETINHLTAILEENTVETWEREDQETETLNLFGLTPKEFATHLVTQEEASSVRYGTTWSISTNWQEADEDNWEHPCNL
jgi:hypothetical protein